MDREVEKKSLRRADGDHEGTGPGKVGPII